jgi:hypothetical protein
MYIYDAMNSADTISHVHVLYMSYLQYLTYVTSLPADAI